MVAEMLVADFHLDQPCWCFQLVDRVHLVSEDVRLLDVAFAGVVHACERCVGKTAGLDASEARACEVSEEAFSCAGDLPKLRTEENWSRDPIQVNAFCNRYSKTTIHAATEASYGEAAERIPEMKSFDARLQWVPKPPQTQLVAVSALLSSSHAPDNMRHVVNPF
jgi:hypothetical protein